MNQKTTARCQQQVASTLAPGEQVELVEGVQIGKVSAKKQAGLAAGSIAVGVATGGTLIVALKPRAFYLVLTNKRLILIDNMRGRVGKVAAACPRDQVSVQPLHTGLLTISTEATMAGAPYRFSWGRVQGGMARKVTDALAAGKTAA
jgi:hypothetical protein